MIIPIIPPKQKPKVKIKGKQDFKLAKYHLERELKMLFLIFLFKRQ